MGPTSHELLQQCLELQSPPVAIAFRNSLPAGVSRLSAPAPASCSYWRLAAEGQIFYTEPGDHDGCPVGAHTHGVQLPAQTAARLNETVQMMVGLQYIKPEEIPAIPHRRDPLRFALYAPLASAPFEPDVVLIRGTAKQLMLLAEAAQAVGAASGGATMGRPTCAVLPETLESGRTATSFGCIGNRVYTGLADEEGYYAIPGPKLTEIAEKLTVIVEANRRLEEFHRGRLNQ